MTPRTTVRQRLALALAAIAIAGGGVAAAAPALAATGGDQVADPTVADPTADDPTADDLEDTSTCQLVEPAGGFPQTTTPEGQIFVDVTEVLLLGDCVPVDVGR